MGDESVQDRRVERVDFRRPSEVFLALWRYYALDQRDRASVDDFAALAETWAQIRELDKIAARMQRRREEIDRNGHLLFQEWAGNNRPCGGATAPEPREGQTHPLQTPTERVSDSDTAEPDDRSKPKDPKKQGVVSIYYEVKEPGHINVAIDCPERMPEDARQAVARKVWAKWHAEADEPREGQAPPLQTPTERVSDSDHSPEEDDEEEAEAEAKKARSLQSAKGFAERKRKALARVEAFRAAGGTLAAIVEASGGKLTMDVLLDLIACKPQPVVTWAALEKALNKLEPAAASAAGGASPSPAGGG